MVIKIILNALCCVISFYIGKYFWNLHIKYKNEETVIGKR